MRIGRHRDNPQVWAAIALTSLLLSGCSASPATTTASSPSDLRKKYPKPIDLANARAECLIGKGWTARVNEDGALEASFPSNQATEYNRDDTACQRVVGIDPDAPTPKAIVKRDYVSYVKAADCLRKKGWPISKSPSLQTFEDTYETEPWMPWNDVPAGDAAKAELACPFPEPTY